MWRVRGGQNPLPVTPVGCGVLGVSCQRTWVRGGHESMKPPSAHGCGKKNIETKKPRKKGSPGGATKMIYYVYCS